MDILIIGGGELVYFLCRTFAAKGYRTTIVNRDRRECDELARRLKATVVHGDGTFPSVLEDAGANTADVLVAVTPNDQDNLVACQVADLHFHVPRILALVNDPDNEEVFRRLGVTVAFSTARVLTSLIEQTAGFEDIVHLSPVGQGKVNITEVVVPESSPVLGEPLRNLELPQGALLAYLLRNGDPIVCRGDTVLEAGDRVILITLPRHHGAALRALTGEQG